MPILAPKRISYLEGKFPQSSPAQSIALCDDLQQQRADSILCPRLHFLQRAPLSVVSNDSLAYQFLHSTCRSPRTSMQSWNMQKRLSSSGFPINRLISARSMKASSMLSDRLLVARTITSGLFRSLSIWRGKRVMTLPASAMHSPHACRQTAPFRRDRLFARRRATPPRLGVKRSGENNRSE